MSNAWVIPESDKAQLEARSNAATAVSDIERRLSELEAEIVNRMQHAEKDVPTCYPPADALSA